MFADLSVQHHQQIRPHRHRVFCFGSTAAKIGAISSQQACSRCCCFITRSWHRATFNQQLQHHRWIGSKPKRHLHTSREMSATPPGRNSSVPQGTAAGHWEHVAAMWGSSGTVDIALPTDKLSATLPHDKGHHPVVLVNCGSFNPPTIMHLRMFDVAAQVLEKVMPQPEAQLPLALYPSQVLCNVSHVSICSLFWIYRHTSCSECTLLCMCVDCMAQIYCIAQM